MTPVNLAERFVAGINRRTTALPDGVEPRSKPTAAISRERADRITLALSLAVNPARPFPSDTYGDPAPL